MRTSKANYSANESMTTLRVAPISISDLQNDENAFSMMSAEVKPYWLTPTSQVSFSLNCPLRKELPVKINNVALTFAISLSGNDATHWRRLIPKARTNMMVAIEIGVYSTDDQIFDNTVEDCIINRVPVVDERWFLQSLKDRTPFLLLSLSISDQPGSLIVTPFVLQDVDLFRRSNRRSEEEVLVRLTPISHENVDVMNSNGINKKRLIEMAVVLEVPRDLTELTCYTWETTIYPLTAFARSRLECAASRNSNGIIGSFNNGTRERSSMWTVTLLSSRKRECGPKEKFFATKLREDRVILLSHHQYLAEDFSDPVNASKVVALECIQELIMALSRKNSLEVSSLSSLDTSKIWVPPSIESSSADINFRDSQANTIRAFIADVLQVSELLKRRKSEQSRLLSRLEAGSFQLVICRLIDLQMLDFLSHLESLRCFVEEGGTLQELLMDHTFKAHISMTQYCCDVWLPRLESLTDKDIRELVDSEMHPLQQLRVDTLSEAMRMKFSWLSGIHAKLRDKLVEDFRSHFLTNETSCAGCQPGSLPYDWTHSHLKDLDEIALVLEVITLAYQVDSDLLHFTSSPLYEVRSSLCTLMAKSADVERTCQLEKAHAQVWRSFHEAFLVEEGIALFQLVKTIFLDGTFLHSVLSRVVYGCHIDWVLALGGVTAEFIDPLVIINAIQSQLDLQFLETKPYRNVYLESRIFSI
eukprot:GHVH01003960.1.p2 GENE.GHVH01003960.1~~GHVH01003960.1.p2  ORF type:complete len:701 (+),score=94.54 GHVH01003960.1:2408-4510(+)